MNLKSRKRSSIAPPEKYQPAYRQGASTRQLAGYATSQNNNLNNAAIIDTILFECFGISTLRFTVLVVRQMKLPNAFQQPSIYSIGSSMALPRNARIDSEIRSGASSASWHRRCNRNDTPLREAFTRSANDSTAKTPTILVKIWFNSVLWHQNDEEKLEKNKSKDEGQEKFLNF
ncbi:hypothetical protein B0H11DRAFT_1908167 [Mycena galericulata]|nr:hypothetical protein B0H11DRAFT_1908167 [Mycena galericulata]